MPHLDQDIVRELRDILGDDLIDVAREFAAQTREQRGALAACQATGDHAEIARLAHLLKGSAANLGGTALAAVASEIEQAGRSGQSDPLPALLERLNDLIDATLAEMRAAGLLTPAD